MMQIDTGMLGIFITVLLAMLGMAASLGALSQKVKHNKEQIDSDRKDSRDDRKDNRDDHQQIFRKLEDINKFIRNGK